MIVVARQKQINSQYNLLYFIWFSVNADKLKQKKNSGTCLNEHHLNFL